MIYRVGQEIELKFMIPMRILRAFAVNDNMYYIVWIKRDGKIRTQNSTPLYGVFRHDDSNGNIPPEVAQMADSIVIREKLLEGLND
jgi:hypothetical protein